MVTNGRPQLIEKAILCFDRQIYQNRELIIVSQATSECNLLIKQLINKPNIHFYAASPKLSLGAMRNLSIEIATGDYICQWDDDDLYHPARISTQLKPLLDKDVIASLYCEHLKFFSHTNELYWIDWSIESVEHRKYLPGTVLFRKEIFFRDNQLYPESGNQSNKEEDWNVLQKLLSYGYIEPIRAGYQYIYVYHGSNVYWLAHHELVLQKRVLTAEEMNKEKVLETLKYVPLPKPIHVKSLEGNIFTYE
jgi:glycosyltransferase involved in cell wall biosynthesis